MYLGTSKNDGGIEISHHRCNACSTEFSVTPAQTGDIRCRLPSCKSYDDDLDMDLRISKGPLMLKGNDGSDKVIKQTPLNPKRTEFLQRNKQGNLIVVRPARRPS